MIALTPSTVAADSHRDIEALKPALGCFPSGVVGLCTSLDVGNPVRVAVSSFTPVSIDPLASVWISAAPPRRVPSTVRVPQQSLGSQGRITPDRTNH